MMIIELTLQASGLHQKMTKCVLIMLFEAATIIGHALLQTHVNVLLGGRDMIVVFPSVNKLAFTMAIVLIQTLVHVNEDGLVTIAQLLSVHKIATTDTV